MGIGGYFANFVKGRRVKISDDLLELLILAHKNLKDIKITFRKHGVNPKGRI